jgi:hypothetical protein
MNRAHRASSPRSPRVLDVLSVVLAAAAVVLLTLPTIRGLLPGAWLDAPPAPMRRPFVVAPAAPAAQESGASRAVLDSAAQTIVRTNAFSSSRREPAERFAAPGLDTAVPTAFDLPDATAGVVPSPEDDAPRLFGIVSANGTLRALLQLPGSVGTPRLMGVGDRQAGMRVQRIERDRVVLSTSTGTRTLRLSRALPDSIENVP